MAVKVKVQKKKPAPVRFTVRDFGHPDERRAKLTGIGIGVGVILVILGIIALIPLRLQLMPVWAGWALLALVYFYAGANGAELRQLTKGSGAVLHDFVADTVSKQARIVGVAAQAPVAAGITELMTVKRTILLPQDLPRRLSQSEMWALIAREMGHIKAGHVGWLSLCRRVEEERRLVYRLLALPLRWMVRGLGNWRWYAAMTADRMSLVLTRDRRAVGAALLKQATAGVEGISASEIDEYLRRQGTIAAQSAEVTTHFKLGEVLRGRAGLMERLRAVGQYAESEEYKQACARLDAAYRKAQKTDTGIPAPPAGNEPAKPRPAGP